MRKRKSRAKDTSEQLKNHHARDKENKWLKRSTETVKQREARLRKNRKRYHKRKEDRVLRNEHLNQQQDEFLIHNECHLSISDRNLLQNFRIKIDELSNKYCPVCNERFLSIDLIQEVCHRCYSDKNLLKKFSAVNNMDPDEVPVELQGLTNIEEMLIAQIFPIVSVYYLRGGQYAYHSNIINFSQDVLEFVIRLPRNPSSLDVLVVCH